MFTYEKSKKYDRLMYKIMGPNPVKLCEELLDGAAIHPDDTVCDLGAGQGLTSVFMAKEYGYRVYASDLWSNPEENRVFFASEGLSDDRLIPVKADANNLPFEKDFFDALVCTDSYNYFGRDPDYLDAKLLPFIKKGGYIYLAITGMKANYHADLPSELLLSWTPEQMEYIQDISYWRGIFNACRGADLLELSEMESNDEVWADWLMQDNPYAVGDRKSMNAGAGRYLNFIKRFCAKIEVLNMVNNITKATLLILLCLLLAVFGSACSAGIEDTNGPDDHSLVTLTDADITKSSPSAVQSLWSKTRVKEEEISKAVTAVDTENGEAGSEEQSDILTTIRIAGNLSGVTVLQSFNSDGTNEFEYSVNLSAGNLRICLVKDGVIKGDLMLDGQTHTAVLPEFGTYELRAAGESATLDITVKSDVYTNQ